MIVATFAFTLIAALATAAVVAVTVLPLYAALQMAEVRRFSTARWMALSTAGVLIGLAGAYKLRGQDDLPSYVALVPLALTWTGPALLWLLDRGQQRVGGRAGLHE